MQQAGQLLTVVFNDRYAAQSSLLGFSVDNVNVKQQNLTILVYLRGWAF